MFKFSDLHLCIIIIIISKITWYPTWRLVHVLVHHTNRSPIFQRITKTLTIYYRCHTSVCGLSCLTHPFSSGNSRKIPNSKAKQWSKIPWSFNKIVRHIWLRNLAISSYRYHIPVTTSQISSMRESYFQHDKRGPAIPEWSLKFAKNSTMDFCHYFNQTSVTWLSRQIITMVIMPRLQIRRNIFSFRQINTVQAIKRHTQPR